MKLSIDTEIEEITELRSAIAIIEDAIKRRESPNDEEQTTVPTSPTSEEPQEQPVQEPKQEEPAEEPQQEAPPEVDISALATSDYGERVENRSMGATSSTTEEPQPVQEEPQEAPAEEQPEEPQPTPEPEPQPDNKTIVKDIIQSLKDKNAGNPIQMQDIVNLAKERNISEEETRNLVNELQSSSSI